MWWKFHHLSTIRRHTTERVTRLEPLNISKKPIFQGFTRVESEVSAYVSTDRACRDGGIDVKEELKTRQKCCRIKGFKTNGSILKCCCWSFSFALPGTYLFKDVPVGGAP